MFKFIYVCNPLDFRHEHQYRTINQIMEMYMNDDCMAENILEKSSDAKRVFKELFKEDFRWEDHEEIIFTSVLQDGCLEDVLIAKAENNGTTYMFTNAILEGSFIMETYELDQKYILK